MTTLRESSDAHFVALLRDRGPLSIAELTAAEGVTATAVRQRLNRLMEQGLAASCFTRDGFTWPPPMVLSTSRASMAQRRAGES